MKMQPDNAGQAMVEYILLLAVVLSIFTAISSWMRGSGFTQKLIKPVKEDFAHAYQYGHPKAKGYGDVGGPDLHPRVTVGNNFRIFLNPKNL